MRSQNTHLICDIALDRKSEIPLRRQLADALAAAIVDGRLPQGLRLPSTRTLANDLSVSRNTAVYAFEFLRSAGFVEIIGATGAIVSPHFILNETSESRAVADIDFSPQSADPRASHSLSGPFCLGNTPAVPFPSAIWNSLCRSSARSLASANGAAGEPGLKELRQSLSVHLRLSRGLQCKPEQIVIVSNVRQALLLTALLTGAQKDVWVENPGGVMPANVLSLSGLKVVPVTVDHSGLNMDHGRKLSPAPRLIYTTTFSPYPLLCRPDESVSGTPSGSTRRRRRFELIEFSQLTGAFILERDLCGDITHNNQPIETLFAQDKRERVIYLGDFEHTLSPALQFAYLIAPPSLAEELSRLSYASGACPPDDLMHTLACFIKQGHYASFVRKIRKHCKTRRDTVIAQLVASLPGGCLLSPISSGRQMVLKLPQGLSDLEVCAALHKRAGLIATPLSSLYIQSEGVSGLVLGFASFSEQSLITACACLAAILADLCRTESRQALSTLPPSTALAPNGVQAV